jgi:hypothetical protein
MKPRCRLIVWMFAVLLIITGGCIPSGPSQPAAPASGDSTSPVSSPPPAVSPAPAAPEVPAAPPAPDASPPRKTSPNALLTLKKPPRISSATSTPAPKPAPNGGSAVRFDVINGPDGRTLNVELTPLPGNAGFRLAGGGLTGTLTPAAPGSAEWNLTGEFEFKGNQAGCEVGTPSVLPFDTGQTPPPGTVSQSIPKSFLVTIPITRSENAAVSQETRKVPVNAKLNAAIDAKFMIIITKG